MIIEHYTFFFLKNFMWLELIYSFKSRRSSFNFHLFVRAGIERGDLFGVAVVRGVVPVSLAIDGGISTAANCVHFPLCVVIVDDVNVSTAAPRHPLHELLPEMVERNRDLHPRVRQVLVAVAQQHHLVVVRKVVVGYRDPRGPHHRVDQPVLAVRQRAVVDPYVLRPEYRDPVPVRSRSPPVVSWA